MVNKLSKKNITSLFRIVCVISLLYLGYVFVLPKLIETFEENQHDELENQHDELKAQHFDLERHIDNKVNGLRGFVENNAMRLANISKHLGIENPKTKLHKTKELRPRAELRKITELRPRAELRKMS